MYYVVVDRLTWSARAWGSRQHRVYAQVPWFWVAKLIARHWVKNHTQGKAIVMDFDQYRATEKELGYLPPQMQDREY